MEEYTVSLALDDWRTILGLAEVHAEECLGEESGEQVLEPYLEPISKARRQLGWEPR